MARAGVESSVRDSVNWVSRQPVHRQPKVVVERVCDHERDPRQRDSTQPGDEKIDWKKSPPEGLCVSHRYPVGGYGTPWLVYAIFFRAVDLVGEGHLEEAEPDPEDSQNEVPVRCGWRCCERAKERLNVREDHSLEKDVAAVPWG